jgi:hypothetical protein
MIRAPDGAVRCKINQRISTLLALFDALQPQLKLEPAFRLPLTGGFPSRAKSFRSAGPHSGRSHGSGVNDDLTNAFDGGTVSQFAQEHLRPQWQLGDAVTFRQTEQEHVTS